MENRPIVSKQRACLQFYTQNYSKHGNLMQVASWLQKRQETTRGTKKLTENNLLIMAAEHVIRGADEGPSARSRSLKMIRPSAYSRSLKMTVLAVHSFFNFSVH